MHTATFQIGSQTHRLEFPRDNLAFEGGLPGGNAHPDPAGAVEAAVDQMFRSLRPNLTARSSVMLLVDDFTRPTPTPLILGPLIERFERVGLSDGQISIMVAGGSHRPMTPRQKQSRIGAEFLDRFGCLDHDHKDLGKLRSLGKLDDGTPLWINRRVLEADVVLAIGTIFPHFPSGFSGGAKMLLPGVAGRETVFHFHLLGVEDPNGRLGRLETVSRRIMEQCAAKTNLLGIVNTILNRDGRIVDVVGGHYVEAHRRGVPIARRAYGLAVPELADLVIADPHPMDSDLLQCHKGAMSAMLAVKPGGRIVLLGACPEGLSPVHGQMLLRFSGMDNDQIKAALLRPGMTHAFGGITAMHMNIVRRRATLAIHSPGIDDQQITALRAQPVPDLQGFIDRYLRRYPSHRVGILHQAAELLPLPPAAPFVGLRCRSSRRR